MVVSFVDVVRPVVAGYVEGEGDALADSWKREPVRNC
jgi:hypothetical protein